MTLVVLAAWLLGSAALAAGPAATLHQLESSLAEIAPAASPGKKGPTRKSLHRIDSLARAVAGDVRHPSPSCRKGLAASERLAGERRQTALLRRDIRAARAGVRTCKVPRHTPGKGSGHDGTPTQPNPGPPTTINTPAGLATVNEIKIVSTWRFHGVGSDDFCWDMPPSQPGATKYWKLEQDADLTFQSDIHLDRSQAGAGSLDLATGSSYTISPQPPCTDPGSYHLGAWTNGQLNAALTIGDDGTGAVALTVPQDVLDQNSDAVWSYGPGLPPPMGDGSGIDWTSQYTYPGFKTGTSEEIDWPSPIDGGSPSVTYTSLGVGGHILAQLHVTKSLDDAPSMTGTAEILIELLSS